MDKMSAPQGLFLQILYNVEIKFLQQILFINTSFKY